ncbi:TIGR01212 family radical SAM protein [Sulfurospirillum diekertiae]|uniref:TIGR01212 family radical SAM protein n=1 Tax=Sulfurospirillum diekertiae TaxID=1854492 RepID=A0A6G9VU23_9BACT|nr:TIGR01212 family radical SAM protein [Sulfurospirillum diekertiae]QIR76202.1 TIGR01212 family radical SAM protein [Sulfurospirillum diekertiae]QIR78830.1 TIGR01212 family radical SAM protein [Sulfurospirillum diekertiae]
MREILTAGRYFRGKFGETIYKIPVSISGFTCPNIDGTVARGGCIFCENESFSPNLEHKQPKRFYLHPTSENPYLEFQLIQLEAQYKKTRKVLSKKFGAQKFIIYFQSFTNTYAPLATLKTLYTKALSFEGVVGLSIGTRTDSVTEEVIAYLAELSKEHEIWLEYGVQSSSDETLKRINRGHDSANIEKYITLSRQYGLKICAHVIFGLPGETPEMALESVKFALRLGVKSFKFHPLYVVKQTALANDLNRGDFIPISEESYIQTIIKAIKLLPEGVMLQRVSAGIEDATLLSPSWCYTKHQQMFNIREALKKEGLLY